MRRWMALGCIILAGLPLSTQAEPWETLGGAQIEEALTGARLTYAGGIWQEFRASGRTLYNAGRDSWGYWAVREDAYCSMWPPSDLWACYAIERAGDRIRFIGESGDISEGRFE